MRLSYCGCLLGLLLSPAPATAQSHSVPLPPRDSPKDGSGSSENKTTEAKSAPKSKDPRSGKKRLEPSSQNNGTSSYNDDDGDLDEHDPSDSGSDASSGSGQDNELSLFGCRTLLRAGGHITLAGTELQKTSNPVGGGPDVLLALGPTDFPLLLGAQFGFDWFGSRTERFTYNGRLTDWDIDRTAFWTHGLIRWMPLTGIVRPHIDLLGGVWVHNVSLDEDLNLSEEDESHSVGQSATGSYGFGFGVDFVTESGFLVGISAVHLRGGNITVPDVKNVAVVDDVLYYGEASASGIHQWMFMLSIGGVSQ